MRWCWEGPVGLGARGVGVNTEVREHSTMCGGWNTFQLQKVTLPVKADEWSAPKPPQLRSVEQACSRVAQPVFLTVTGWGGISFGRMC